MQPAYFEQSNNETHQENPYAPRPFQMFSTRSSTAGQPVRACRNRRIERKLPGTLRRPQQSIDTKNLQAARGMFSTDYTQLRVDGAGRNLDQTIEQLAATGSGDSNLEVLSVTQEDTQATVSVRSHALMQPPALVSENRPLKLEVQRSDTWVKGDADGNCDDPWSPHRHDLGWQTGRHHHACRADRQLNLPPKHTRPWPTWRRPATSMRSRSISMPI